MNMCSGETKRRKKVGISLKQVFVLFTAFLFLTFTPVGAIGAEQTIIPSISIMESYSDNVFLTPEYHIRSWITTITPGLAYIAKTERLDVGLSAQGKFDFYTGLNKSTLEEFYLLSGDKIGDQSLDSISQYYNATAGYSITPRFRLTGNAGWTRDYQPDRDIMETGLSMGDYRRDRITAGVTGSWGITERLTMGVGYNFAKDDYANDGMSDLTIHQASMWFYYTLTPKMKARLNTGYGHYYYTLTTQDTNMFWGTVGIDYQIHELWTITFDVGARYATSKFPVEYDHDGDPLTDPWILDETSSNWGGIARTSLNYADDKNTLTLSANYDIAPASSSMGSGPVQRLAFLANGKRRLVYELYVFLSGGYYINKASAGELQATEVDTETYRISPGLRYEFTKDMALDLSYEYLNLHDRCLDTNAQRNLVMLRFYFQWPITL